MARTLDTLFLAGLLVGTTACDTRKGDGGTCETNENCKDGLICQANLCGDATKVMKLRAKNLQRTGQQFMHDHSGSCPKVADLGDVPERTDAWGNPFVIVCPSEHSAIDIVSNGPDGSPGTEDDIPSWD